ncbi:ascomycete fungal laccase from thielavia arenaria [Tricladium varicosporioides]|nr:ascomycete fungal laccase from thielavia arenaria [Hymenoscyphus varicosporioides]
MWTTSILHGFMSNLLLVGLIQAAPTCNTPSNRACWTSSTNIYTDYETTTPNTGVTKSFTLTITEADNFVGGDGHIKTKAMLINGPTLTADWGDTISVNVINNLRTNGTSIHWHGVRMLNNNINDGANGVTECPIPPGHSKTYTFLAQQYGTTWYHSHTSSQYANGVTGSIVINGPASLPYDIDLGPLHISDWYYGAADVIQRRVSDPNNPLIPGAPGAPPPSDNILFNGRNIDPSGAGGAYQTLTLTPGKRHLLRLINPSVENTYTVSLVGHSMTVIGTDFVPVNSITTNSIFMGIGQRYLVTIDASQPVGNYWFNVTFSNTGACGTSNNPHPAMIFKYTGAPNALPTSMGVAPDESLCADSLNYQPVVSRTAPLTNFSPVNNNLPVTFDVEPSLSKVFWKVNSSAMQIQWNKPTLQYVLEGNTSYPLSENILQVPTANIWSVWLIQNVSPVPHPMHLHGHDFLILGKSPALTNPFAGSPRPFNPASDTPSLQTTNPARRDVTMLPGFGWVVVAFKTDNPGAWLFHCHIAWHVSQGLSVQFLERLSSIPTSMNLNTITPNCQAWNAYYPTDLFQQADSGLKARD